jgi:hypothetical protein
VPAEWIVTAMAGVIGTLGTVVGILWRNHLAQDKRERDRADAIDNRMGKLADALRDALVKAKS